MFKVAHHHIEVSECALDHQLNVFQLDCIVTAAMSSSFQSQTKYARVCLFVCKQQEMPLIRSN